MSEATGRRTVRTSGASVRSRSTPPSQATANRPRRVARLSSHDPPATRRSLEDGVRGEGLGPVREEDHCQQSPASQSSRSEDTSSTENTSPRNRKQNRVQKFPPHPPTSEPPHMKSLPPDLTKASDFPDMPSKLEDGVPLSQEESSSISESSAWSISQSHSASDSGIHSAQSRLSREYSMPNLHSLNQGMDMDGKFRQDILHGLEYFEQRNNELKKLNKKLLRDLDRMTEANKHLEGHIEELNKKYKALVDDNDELKIQLDQLGKENGRYEQQAMGDWKNKIELEEKYVMMKNSADQELNKLKEQLQGAGHKENSRQLEGTITQLQEEMHKMNIDREKSVETHERLQREMRELQDVHRQKVTELEAQYKRFLSLKKSYNDLLEESESTKKNSSQTLGSSTWPSNKVMHALETVHLIDFPSKKGPSYKATNSGKILPATPAQNAVRSKMVRNRTDGLGRSENLPPVTNQAQ